MTERATRRAVDPTNSELALVPVIGGGPAGMSCALWLHNYGFRPLIMEREHELGGMARRSPYPNEWLLGWPGTVARQNAEQFARHIRLLAIDTWLGARPQRLAAASDGLFVVKTSFCDERPPQSVSCRAVVIATGTQFRGAEWLDEVPNARAVAAAGRLHIGPPYAGEPDADLGDHIAIIGGGDNAFDVARMVAEKGVKVTVVMRSHKPKAQPLLVARLREYESAGRAQVLAQRTVERLDIADERIRIRLSGGYDFDVDHVVLLFGYRPHTGEPWLAELALVMDEHGYLAVDRNGETSCRGVFAIGDVANPVHPCIATAIASGTMAAREIQKRFALPSPARSTPRNS